MPTVKIKKDQHSDILDLYDDGIPVQEIAKIYGVNRSTVFRIINRDPYEKFSWIKGMRYMVGTQGTVKKINPVDFSTGKGMLDKGEIVKPINGKYRIEQSGAVRFLTMAQITKLIKPSN